VARLWYVKKRDATLGPFPAGAVLSDRLVGRIASTDELSPDREEWRPFENWPELAALAEQASSSATVPEWLGERSKARLRWHDQRSGTDRRVAAETAEASERKCGPDRRARDEADGSARTPKTSRPRLIDEPILLKIVIALALTALIVASVVWLFGPVNPVQVRIH
jgi:hypothetical protein